MSVCVRACVRAACARVRVCACVGERVRACVRACVKWRQVRPSRCTFGIEVFHFSRAVLSTHNIFFPCKTVPLVRFSFTIVHNRQINNAVYIPLLYCRALVSLSVPLLIGVARRLVCIAMYS